MLGREEMLELCNRFKTPFYLFDGEVMHHNYFQIKNSLHRQIDLFLSLKANNNISIAHLFQQWGSGIEVASKGELILALKAGFEPERIIFSGPGKRIEELQMAIDMQIYCIVVESLHELELIHELALEQGRRVNIAVRVNPDKDITRARIKMAGTASPFGIDESQLGSFFEYLSSKTFIHFIGLHVYTGTQILDAEKIIDSFAYTINMAKDIYNKHGILCEMIDLGGGFGIPYFTHEKPLDMQWIIRKLNEIVDRSMTGEFSRTRLIIESGRFLLAEAGTYITKILYSKISKNEKFYIVDGGMHHHAASTFRGRLMRSNYKIRAISKDREVEHEETEKVNIVGPLCTPEDCIGKDVQMPALELGDFICVLNSGAYGLTYSPIYFLGHPTPYEILKWNNAYIQIRERGAEEDLYLKQNIIVNQLQEGV